MYLISFSSMIFVLINVIHSRQKYLDLDAVSKTLSFLDQSKNNHQEVG